MNFTLTSYYFIPPALDYANLLSCTLEYNSDHLLILEDDLKPAKHVLDKIYHTVNETLRIYPDWGSLTLFGHRFRPDPITNVTPYGTSGGCAMVLRKNIAGGFVKFVRSDPYAAPVDMLLPRYIENNNLKVYERSPNLFQHISPHSTYSGKVIQPSLRKGHKNTIANCFYFLRKITALRPSVLNLEPSLLKGHKNT